MQARFLLGPAGSGKTFRCLAEIRAELLRAPDGLPLILLAPKQATFQLERQLLGWGESPREPLTKAKDGSPGVSPHQLHGYTRLQILSFDRLAQFVAAEYATAAADWLDDEGRVMVLRALLAEKRSELRLFHASARLPGFANRLSLLLRELQRNQISPDRLLTLAEKIPGPSQLRDKLHDFALLLRGYIEWLKTHNLRDADSVLDIATAILHPNPELGTRNSELHIAGLWLDGFSEMTVQELDLLAALAPRCEQSTLAFCLETEPQAEPSWLSTWSVTGQTFLRCREHFAELPGMKVSIETLERDQPQNRFTESPALAHLEKCWTANTIHNSPFTIHDSALRLASCTNPEAEAVLAAREIRRFVRGGGRFREAAVIVRSLDSYADTLRRIFERYEIPYFLDRREPVTHHPLAELTRYALRTVAFNWRQADWFGALKTGLVSAREDEIDWLENIALESGWEGEAWRQPLIARNQSAPNEPAERLRQKLIPPFAALAQQTNSALTGKQLAAALREFWNSLDVEITLKNWSESNATAQSAIHTTVWEQMHAWLDNLERAFPTEALPVREWLPILEAGLATLTVGVVPPALDQVLIGAIDRSRNPDLKLALVLGLNEGVFPAPPAEDPLLNELERDALTTHGTRLGLSARHRVGHEWFYGYIAATRASQRLVLTCAQFDARGNKLNRSPFFDRLEKIFPDYKLENWQPPSGFSKVEHVSEIIAPAVRLQSWSSSFGLAGDTLRRELQPAAQKFLALPKLGDVLSKAREVADAISNQHLSPAIAGALHGRELATSVSALEDFAACPFKFFVSRGLRAQERKLFELDARERGSFQHEVLTVFHNEMKAGGCPWRKVAPEDARRRVRRIGENLLPTYQHGLFTTDAARRFAGGTLLDSLETLIAVLVGWARDYQFDPELVETGFGLPGAPWPAWRLDVGDDRALLLRGRIDRVDIWRDPASGAALAVVVDYKSSSRKPDRVKLHHGLQLQLPAYLAAIEKIPGVRETLGVSSLAPAGVFYVNLRGEFSSAKSRAEALADPALTLREGFQHFGRYDENQLSKLDPHGTGEQFKTHKRSHDRMDAMAFQDLLNRTVENLRRFGREIFSGKIAPAPFRKGTETACDFCDYASVCRFDPWTQPFRTLKETPEGKS